MIENIKRRINLIDRAADRRAQLERTHMDPDHDPALEAIEEAAALNNRWSTLYWCAVCGQKREEFLNTHVPK